MTRPHFTRSLALVGLVSLGWPALVVSADPPFATLEAAAGQVVVVRLGQSQPPAPGMALQLDDIVLTKRGRASVRFVSDGTVLRIGPDSRVQINESAAQRDITVFFGRLWAHVVKWRERPTRFATSGTIAAVRGTEVSMAVESDGDRTQLAVLEGLVLAQNDAGTLELRGGQSATARKGTAPARGVPVKPKDAVQWALYYLPVVYAKPGEIGEGAAWQTKTRESQEAFAKGDLDGAIARLEGIDDGGIREPKFFTYRASLRLATGNVDEAAKDLDRALKLSEKDGNALALQSIIAVARNETDKALTLARQAVSAAPKSAAPQVALSYAQQARFDLEGARQSLETAVQLEPENALAWARLAEIRSSLGRLDIALEAARKAAELAPGLSRAQTVLGYAYLTQVRTAEAKAAFGEAIKRDQSDPLPRLGLGLAQIRDGALADGSKEIEVALSLDPGQSVARSYLGKAYYEARREDLVGREYDLAKQTDPNDPTPFLYDAIHKQTTNRPVEALRDNQKAIELNDNRAVYRSRLLLDADLAARSAALGRIYNDLGFQSLGLVEGWNSVNTDASDFSGHRLLADNYAAMPRHEIARVSELLQSQMLQPINTTPIQPRLAESNLLLIAGGGPASLSFSEFNPLFNRDGVHVLGNFLAGEDDTLSGEAIVAGIYRKFSFSAGYSGFKTDGFRENADQDDQIANVFLQGELSPSTSVQAEYRYRDSERGEVRLRFFPEDFSPTQDNTEKRHTGRFGVRHTFSPGSVLLGSATYQDGDFTFLEEPGDFLTSIRGEVPAKAFGLEAQHLYRSRRFDLATGIGYFDIDADLHQTIVFNEEFIPPPDNVEESTTPLSLKHLNLYAYAHVKPVDRLKVIAGASADILDGDSPEAKDQDQFNPKVGLIWNLTPTTTLRAAAFKVLKRTLITDQTLEPTQVAGFNQFYDDLNATRAWRYGGALDQKFTKSLFGGAELAKRDLSVPTIGDEGVVERQDVDEWLARAYFLAAPSSRLALRAEYLFERTESQGFSINIPVKLDTHRLPLGVGFFDPSGFGASATVTYFNQDGEIVRITNEPAPVFDDFWTVDVNVSYRLPKRYGFLSVGATNLFDEKFNYYEVDIRNPTIQPARRIYARITLAF